MLVRCKEPFCFLSGFRASIGLPSWSRRPGQGIHSEAKETPLSRARPHVCADGKSSCEVSSVMKVDVLGPYSHPVVKMPDILTEEEDCKAHVPSVLLSLTVPLCLSLPPCFHVHTHTHTHTHTRTWACKNTLGRDIADDYGDVGVPSASASCVQSFRSHGSVGLDMERSGESRCRDLAAPAADEENTSAGGRPDLERLATVGMMVLACQRPCGRSWRCPALNFDAGLT